MRISGWKSWCITAGAIAGIAVFLSASANPPRLPGAQSTAQSAAQEIVLSLDPAQTKVHYAVDTTLHTVHGTFALKNGSVHLDPESGKAGGEVIVLATSGDSGNSSRDARMHKEILETAKYPDAIFRPTQIEGKVARSGNSDVKLQGIFSIHGGEHAIAVPVHAELSGDHWKGTAKFQIPYIQWGIKDPSSWLLKVKPKVDVELEMYGSVKSAN
jgi:polyisoprenoid-binding protein YceI